MKAEEFLDRWFSKKYAGAKEVGEWTTGEVINVLKDFQKQIWEEAQEVIFESEEDEICYTIEYLEAEDLKNILEQN